MKRASNSKVGFVTTWNQVCGLATFAKFLTDCFDSAEKIILAEESWSKTSASEEPWVERCWTIGSGNYARLEAAVVKHQLSVLHLNCQARFFVYPSFTEFVGRMKRRGVAVIAHVHSIFTIEDSHRLLAESSDLVIVHGAETRLELIAHGVTPAKVRVIPHGVLVREHSESIRSAARRELSLPTEPKILLSFGFLQPHKGMEALLEAVIDLRGKGINAHGVIVGGYNIHDPGSRPYLEALKGLVAKHNIAENISFISSFVPEETLFRYMSASDLIVLNYRSQHFEGSGVGSLAVGSGVPVIASTAPAFSGFADAMFRITSGFQPGLAAELLLSNEQLRSELLVRAREYSERCSWPNIARTIRGFYSEVLTTATEETVMNKPKTSPLKVLMQNRGGTFAQRGGDTVVIERLRDGLAARGIDVTVDIDGTKEPKDFDLVHLFNFAIPDMIRVLGQRAKAAGVPFVVTTLAEDVPAFHNQSRTMSSTLIEYTQRGQNREWWSERKDDWQRNAPCQRFDNEWVVRNAAALFVNGREEAETIRRDYQGVTTVRQIKLGFEHGAEQSGELFSSQFGVRDFVFCVGRLESRKNQLALLKALEDSEIPVVLAGGGFSYQPDYAHAVKTFKRKGQTVVLDRVSPELLASAYAACRVHALPSWYELPGLVTLEAAAYGKNVVAVRNGTIGSYLGELPYYCLPGDTDSIRNAVMAAYYSPVSGQLRATARSFSWEATIDQTIRCYEELVGTKPTLGVSQQAQISAPPIFDGVAGTTEFQDLLEKGELAAKSIDFASAHEFLRKAEAINANSARMLKARGATFLAEGNLVDGRAYFERALRIAPNDEKVLSGRGMCEMLDRRFDLALPYFQRAIQSNPEHKVALIQLSECFRELARGPEAEPYLRAYLARTPDDQQIKEELDRCLPVSSNVKWQLRLDEQNRVEELEEAKRQREFDKAKQVIEKIRTAGGLSPAMKARIDTTEAEMLALDGDLKKADLQLSAVLSEVPEYPRALCGKGALAAEGQRWSEARDYFARAERAERDNDTALAGLAICEMEAGRLEEAWNLFKRAANKNPENQRAVLGVLQLGYPKKAFGEIEGVLKSFLEYHPVNLDMQYSLAGVFYAQRRVGEAKTEVEKILLFDPKHERALELKAMIDSKEVNASEIRV